MQYSLILSLLATALSFSATNALFINRDRMNGVISNLTTGSPAFVNGTVIDLTTFGTAAIGWEAKVERGILFRNRFASVKFTIDDKRLAIDSKPPFKFSWVPTVGPHVLVVTAYRKNKGRGKNVGSLTIAFTVIRSTKSPTKAPAKPPSPTAPVAPPKAPTPPTPPAPTAPTPPAPTAPTPPVAPPVKGPTAPTVLTKAPAAPSTPSAPPPSAPSAPPPSAPSAPKAPSAPSAPKAPSAPASPMAPMASARRGRLY